MTALVRYVNRLNPLERYWHVCAVIIALSWIPVTLIDWLWVRGSTNPLEVGLWTVFFTFMTSVLGFFLAGLGYLLWEYSQSVNKREPYKLVEARRKAALAAQVVKELEAENDPSQYPVEWSISG